MLIDTADIDATASQTESLLDTTAPLASHRHCRGISDDAGETAAILLLDTAHALGAALHR